MEYTQAQPPEGINTSKEHPLKEFTWLVSGITLAIISVIIILSLSANWLAPYIPFSAEQKIFKNFSLDIEQNEDTVPNILMTDYLQTLTNRLSVAADLPDGMTITVHYVESNVVNAFATLGGHIIIFRGLLEKIPHENALAMVMAHEIAHIKFRHPIRTLGRAVVTGTAIAVISSAIGGDIVEFFMGETGLLTALSFSREQEKEADVLALTALTRLYGHIGGADQLFNVLEQAHEHTIKPPEFFSSHPHTGNRIASIESLAADNNWATHGAVSALPDKYHEWIKVQANDQVN